MAQMKKAGIGNGSAKKQGLTVRVRPWDLEKRISFDLGLT
jgi:hypothetical protein